MVINGNCCFARSNPFLLAVEIVLCPQMVPLAMGYHPFKFGQKDNLRADNNKISKPVNISSYFSWEGQVVLDISFDKGNTKAGIQGRFFHEGWPATESVGRE